MICKIMVHATECNRRPMHRNRSRSRSGLACISNGRSRLTLRLMVIVAVVLVSLVSVQIAVALPVTERTSPSAVQDRSPSPNIVRKSDSDTKPGTFLSSLFGGKPFHLTSFNPFKALSNLWRGKQQSSSPSKTSPETQEATEIDAVIKITPPTDQADTTIKPAITEDSIAQKGTENKVQEQRLQNLKTASPESVKEDNAKSAQKTEKNKLQYDQKQHDESIIVMDNAEKKSRDQQPHISTVKKSEVTEESNRLVGVATSGEIETKTSKEVNGVDGLIDDRVDVTVDKEIPKLAVNNTDNNGSRFKTPPGEKSEESRDIEGGVEVKHEGGGETKIGDVLVGKIDLRRGGEMSKLYVKDHGRNRGVKGSKKHNKNGNLGGKNKIVKEKEVVYMTLKNNRQIKSGGDAMNTGVAQQNGKQHANLLKSGGRKDDTFRDKPHSQKDNLASLARSIADRIKKSGHPLAIEVDSVEKEGPDMVWAVDTGLRHIPDGKEDFENFENVQAPGIVDVGSVRISLSGGFVSDKNNQREDFRSLLSFPFNLREIKKRSVVEHADPAKDKKEAIETVQSGEVSSRENDKHVAKSTKDGDKPLVNDNGVKTTTEGINNYKEIDNKVDPDPYQVRDDNGNNNNDDDDDYTTEQLQFRRRRRRRARRILSLANSDDDTGDKRDKTDVGKDVSKTGDGNDKKGDKDFENTEPNKSTPNSGPKDTFRTHPREAEVNSLVNRRSVSQKTAVKLEDKRQLLSNGSLLSDATAIIIIKHSHNNKTHTLNGKKISKHEKHEKTDHNKHASPIHHSLQNKGDHSKSASDTKIQYIIKVLTGKSSRHVPNNIQQEAANEPEGSKVKGEDNQTDSGPIIERMTRPSGIRPPAKLTNETLWRRHQRMGQHVATILCFLSVGFVVCVMLVISGAAERNRLDNPGVSTSSTALYVRYPHY